MTVNESLCVSDYGSVGPRAEAGEGETATLVPLIINDDSRARSN